MLTTYALEAKKNGSIKSEDFKVTPEMRQQVYERLKAKGVRSSARRSTTRRSRLIDEQLGYEIARYVFGRPAEFRRRAQDDEQMQTAMGLLRKAAKPEGAA